MWNKTSGAETIEELNAEYLAETAQFCICQPKEIPVGWGKCLVAHWWMREPRLHILDEDGDVKRTIVQCALCGIIIALTRVGVKRIGGGQRHSSHE